MRLMRPALVPLVALAGTALALLACASTKPHDATPPMPGSAAISPSPARAERVPSDSAVPVASAPSVLR